MPSISWYSRARFRTVGFYWHRHFTRHKTRQLGIVLGIKLGNSALYSAIGILLGIKLSNQHLYQVTIIQTLLVPDTIKSNSTETENTLTHTMLWKLIQATTMTKTMFYYTCGHVFWIDIANLGNQGSRYIERSGIHLNAWGKILLRCRATKNNK